MEVSLLALGKVAVVGFFQDQAGGESADDGGQAGR